MVSLPSFRSGFEDGTAEEECAMLFPASLFFSSSISCNRAVCNAFRRKKTYVPIPPTARKNTRNNPIHSRIKGNFDFTLFRAQSSALFRRGPIRQNSVPDFAELFFLPDRHVPHQDLQCLFRILPYGEPDSPAVFPGAPIAEVSRLLTGEAAGSDQSSGFRGFFRHPSTLPNRECKSAIRTGIPQAKQ